MAERRNRVPVVDAEGAAVQLTLARFFLALALADPPIFPGVGRAAALRSINETLALADAGELGRLADKHDHPAARRARHALNRSAELLATSVPPSSVPRSGTNLAGAV